MPRGVYPRTPKVTKVPNVTSKTFDATSDLIEDRDREFTVADVHTHGPKPLVSESIEIPKAGDMSAAQFMEELVEVMIHGDHHDGAENGPAYLNVNGEAYWVDREIPVKIKRKHLAVLATAKTGSVKQKRIIAPDGSQAYVEIETAGLSYPFSVSADPNPRGPMWLREILRQPA